MMNGHRIEFVPMPPPRQRFDGAQARYLRSLMTGADAKTVREAATQFMVALHEFRADDPFLRGHEVAGTEPPDGED